MEFNKISSLKPIDVERSFTIETEKPQGEGQNFGSVLAAAVGKTNSSLNNVSELSRQLATGELKNMHDLTIAELKADMLLKMTTQVASKLATSAQTIFQMQI